MTTPRKFVAVRFANGKHDIVPNHWLFETNGRQYCRWPPEEVEEKSKTYEPPQSSWAIYVVSTFITESSSYEGAEKKLYTPDGYETSAETVDVERVEMGPTGCTTSSARIRSPMKVPVQNPSHVSPSTPRSSTVDSLGRPRKDLTAKLMKSRASNRSTAGGSAAVRDETHHNAALLSMMSSLQLDVKKIKKHYRSTETKLNTLLEAVNSLQRLPPANTTQDLPGPAATLEDLNDLVKNPNELVMVLKCMIGVNLKDTIRRMLKRMMTPAVATQFSYSGLGTQRQQTKLAFKNHRGFHILIEAIGQCGFNEDMKMKVCYIQDVLRHCNEWNGCKRMPALGKTQDSRTGTVAERPAGTDASRAAVSPRSSTASQERSTSSVGCKLDIYSSNTQLKETSVGNPSPCGSNVLESKSTACKIRLSHEPQSEVSGFESSMCCAILRSQQPKDAAGSPMSCQTESSSNTPELLSPSPRNSSNHNNIAVDLRLCRPSNEPPNKRIRGWSSTSHYKKTSNRQVILPLVIALSATSLTLIRSVRTFARH